MSHESLTPEQIAALYEQAGNGELPEPAAPETGPARRARRPRSLDFSRPTKFGSDHQRRLRRAAEIFCSSAATRMPAEHRIPLEVEVLDVVQLTWAGALERVHSSSIAAWVEAPAIEGRMLLTAELELMLDCIERVMGGTGTGVHERRLTQIEVAVSRRLMDTFVEALSITWRDFAEVDLQLGEIEALSESSVHIPASEATLLFTFEARVDRRSATMSLLIPWVAVAPIADALAGRGPAHSAPDPANEERVRARLGEVEVPLRAEVADLTLTMQDVLALAPGDVLHFAAPASTDITVFAQDIAVHRARAGRSGSRRAIQIISGIEGGRR